ncbi:peptidylprolyl isomerase [Aurantimonas sp. VKM B-3413]|uniref:peptidylprolyl isomerase n=1 Tax=Aurantimonas sp. VKM B-3413 TaxID=2779401 RepID=UPI001E33636B|nr:peptidylprolyl isomerase [Aurantimonas sp. VKM B-3413]MCB8836010.1 peptidylprolyl isomerase [Aurantimonas sp. VKM B-3413]
MNVRSLTMRMVLTAVVAGSLAFGAGVSAGPARAASEIAVVVNKQPITSYQIRQRAAFLRLRHEGGNVTQKATDELIDEALKKQQIRARGINIPDSAVDAAYANFAKQNRLTLDQLGQVLSQAGFSPSSFKDYIRVQMGWGQAVQAHIRNKDKLSEQDVVQRMLAQGGKKPSTTEYTLQQVIFVVPEKERSSGFMDRRKREANAMRTRFKSCASTYDIAKGLTDVTVRDLGRVAQPELPPRWKDDIMKTEDGRTTPAQVTERGVEFIAVCDSRNVSDDVAAAMVFQSRDLKELGEKGNGPDEAWLKELRKKAQIVRK